MLTIIYCFLVFNFQTSEFPQSLGEKFMHNMWSEGKSAPWGRGMNGEEPQAAVSGDARASETC